MLLENKSNYNPFATEETGRKNLKLQTIEKLKILKTKVCGDQRKNQHHSDRSVVKIN